MVELRALRGDVEALIVPEVVLSNRSLDVGTVAASGTVRTEAEWESEVTAEAWQFHREFVELVQTELGEVRIDYTPQSYVGVRRGRRVWAPLWLLRDGARTYLPDPDGSREDEPSLAFEYFRDELAAVGVDIAWTSNYNAGSNPISLALRSADLTKPEVMDLLRASFRALDAGGLSWSETRGSAAAEASQPTPASDSGGIASSDD